MTAKAPADGHDFGQNVAVSGTLAIVGAPGDNHMGDNAGSAYIYEYSGGKWQYVTQLYASDAAEDDAFGSSVAIDGTHILVGAPRDDNNTGSVYAFQSSGGVWTQIQKITASDAAVNTHFGNAVDISGTRAIIGSVFATGNASLTGAAYMFSFNGTIWNQTGKVYSADGVAYERFGHSVAIDGTLSVVGAPYDEDNGSRSGSVFVYYPDKTGVWRLDEKLTASDGSAWDEFGTSVDIDGDYLIAGAPIAWGSVLDSGAAYAFHRISAVWYEEDKLVPSVSADIDFGIAVSISGSKAVIGAYGYDLPGGTGINVGEAFCFTRSGTDWTETQILTDSEANQYDYFGTSVGIDGNHILCGAPEEDSHGQNAGAAYWYYWTGSTYQQIAKKAPDDASEGDVFGSSVAISGKDIIVGAQFDDDNQMYSGSAYLFELGSGVPYQKLTAADAGSYDYFGYSVALDSDYALAGAWAAAGNTNSSGAAYIFNRSGDTWTQQDKLVASDGADDDRFGISVDMEGIYALIGALDDDFGNYSGSAYVFTRSGSSWSQTEKMTASDGATSDEFGHSVSLSGDRCVIGAWKNNNVAANAGAAYLFQRSGSDWIEQQKLTASDAAYDDRFGSGVAISGDYVVVGAMYDDDGGSNSGSAYIFHYNGSTWIQEAKITAGDPGEDARFGSAVAIDGAYVVVGAPYYGAAGSQNGAIYLFERNGTSWTQIAKFAASNLDEHDNLGNAVCIQDHAVVGGATGNDTHHDASGAAYLFARPGVEKQFDFNDSTVQQWTLEGAYDENGNGPYSSNFTNGWNDVFNYPTDPGADPSGDGNGSIQMYTPDHHGITGISTDWYIMRFRSPNLSGYANWQQAFAYTCRIHDDMSIGSTDLYSNQYCKVYDKDQEEIRYFYSGTAQEISTSQWSYRNFNWSGLAGFPDSYVLMDVFVNVWGLIDHPYEPIELSGSVCLDDVFATRPLHVTYPNGSETLLSGQTRSITWDRQGSISQVNIDYSTDNGQTWVPVSPPNSGNTGSYSWLVPAVFSSQCLVRVTDASNASTFDTSDDVFTIRADRLYVNVNVVGGLEDGSSWANAFKQMQEALASAVDGDEIWVAQGTYLPDPTGLSNARDATFQLINGVAIYGGFAGTETAVSQRDIDNNVTILSGDIGTTSDASDNCYHVVMGSGTDSTAVMDGFTVTAGNANGGYHPANKGGGLYNNPGSPTIQRCTFLQNSALGHRGGGVFNMNGSHPTISECVFQENTGGDGGGMTNESNCSPTITDCIFLSNETAVGPWTSSGGSGGAIHNRVNSSPVIERCTFLDNQSGDDAGAIMNYSGCYPVIKNCIFSGNSSNDKGGAIYVRTTCGATVTNSTFYNNSADFGGGVYIWSNGDAVLENCILWANTASYGSQIGCDNVSTASVRYCDVQGGMGGIDIDGTSSVTWGLGNIDVDPLFYNPASDDFHLQSYGWRWDPVSQSWDFDSVTSQCADAGCPGYPLGDELLTIPDDPGHNYGINVRINMGAYGGTAEATMPYHNNAVLTDVNNDGISNLVDLSELSLEWMTSGDKLPCDFDRDGSIGLSDLILMAENHLAATSWH